MNISESLIWAKRVLGESKTATPDLDAEILLGHVLGSPRSFLIAHSSDFLSKNAITCFQKLIAKRAEGAPVAFLLGKREFFDLSFSIEKGVLCPRPETEFLVEKTLHLVQGKTASTIIDVGTGSGCIALSLAHSLPDTHRIFGIENSKNALRIAKKNASLLKINSVSFVESDLLKDFLLPADTPCPIIFVVNLPYIPEGDDLPREVIDHDPPEALWSGKDGLDHYRRFFRELSGHFDFDFVLFEFHPPQRKTLSSIRKDMFPDHILSFFPDLSGNLRFGMLSRR